jgi:tellurite resistance protein
METTILSLAMLNLNELEAFVELMFLAAYTDGAVNEAERAAFRGQVIKGTHGQLDASLVDTILKHIESTMGATPADERDEQLTSIRDRLKDPRKRRAALVHAARVVLADGILGLDEVEFLKRAAVALGEPPELADQVLREAREPSA